MTTEWRCPYCYRSNTQTAKTCYFCSRVRPAMERLAEVGDHMATMIEERWSGSKGCSCPVCSSAQEWWDFRAGSSKEGQGWHG